MILRTLLALSAMTILGSAAQAAVPIPLHLFREAEPRILRTQIPSETNLSVQKWVRYFSVEDRERFDRFMNRGALYKTLVQDIMIENGVPPEMYYLAMIESGFARRAKSSAAAVGVWQFMPMTARLSGLRVDRDVDERIDVIRATRAAARHLKSLRNEFGSWNLAMAAYNCGSGCVRKAIRRGGTRDFWKLARRGNLPDETANYIPKFQAAMMIAKAPEKYGFRRKTIYEFPIVQRVRVPARMHLADVARKHRVSAVTIAALNPHLTNGRTPAKAGYEVWVPTGLSKLRRR